MRRGLVLLASIVLPLVPVRPAAAFHEDLTAVWETELDGPTWVAVRIAVAPGDEETTDIAFALDEMTTDGEWLLDASHVLDEDGAPTFASLSGGGCGGGPSVYLRVGEDPPVLDERGTTGCSGSAASGLGLPPGTYTIVHIVGSDGAFSARLSFLTADNVTVLGRTSGDAFDAADTDFGGQVNGHARAIAAEAQTIVGGSVAQTIEASLFGWFVSDGNTLMHTDGPDGRVEPGFVFFGEPPGDYAFTVDAKADADVVFWTRVWLLGADVTLPTP